jgi:hypothetical protein
MEIVVWWWTTMQMQKLEFAKQKRTKSKPQDRLKNLCFLAPAVKAKVAATTAEKHRSFERAKELVEQAKVSSVGLWEHMNLTASEPALSSNLKPYLVQVVTEKCQAFWLLNSILAC